MRSASGERASDAIVGQVRRLDDADDEVEVNMVVERHRSSVTRTPNAVKPRNEFHDEKKITQIIFS